MEIKFSKGLRMAAINEVRALHKRKTELLEMQVAKNKELDDIRREISGISESIQHTCMAFGFEYRGVRDENGNLVSEGDGSSYKRDYFFEEEEEGS